MRAENTIAGILIKLLFTPIAAIISQAAITLRKDKNSGKTGVKIAAITIKAIATAIKPDIILIFIGKSP